MNRKDSKRYRELIETLNGFGKEDYKKPENRALLEEYRILVGKYFNTIGAERVDKRERYIGV